MLLTQFNIYVRKYSCRWILNIMHQPYEVNATYMACMLDVIGDYKKLIDNIIFQLILNMTDEEYRTKEFYSEWESLKSYTRDGVCNHILRLINKYPKSMQIICDEIIIELEQIGNMRTNKLENTSFFNMLYLPDKLTERDYEFILLLHTLKCFPKISKFIAENTDVFRDNLEFARILGIDTRTAENIESTLVGINILKYQNGKLFLSGMLDLK